MSPIISRLIAGFAIAAGFTANVAALGPSAVNLGAAGTYAILAKTGVSTVPNSAITGNVAVSPAAGTFLTGFSLTENPSTTFSTSSQVTGQLFAADYTNPTPSTLTTAISNMQAAFVDASGRVNPDHINVGSGNIGGQLFTPGLYKWTSAVTIPSTITIAGGLTDTWIFQITGPLGISNGVKVTLTGGALSRNIVWVVNGAITLGTTSHLEGVVLAASSVTLGTASSLNGRILSQSAVNLQQSTVSQPGLL